MEGKKKTKCAKGLDEGDGDAEGEKRALQLPFRA